jgi:prepilin-type N-terminal cleavage/methylation domain-containing protein
MRAGFTLVELLISIAIIGVVSSIVLVKYSSFDSTVLLKGLAYEIALSLREAQVRSVSVSGVEGTSGDKVFDYPFGVTFSLVTTQDQKKYTSFRFNDAALTSYPKYGIAESEDIQVFTIDRTMYISQLCITRVTEDCDIQQLDVSFRRPKFVGLFHAVSTGGASEYDTDITSAKIKVTGAGAVNTFVVTITSLGQISVSKE